MTNTPPKVVNEPITNEKLLSGTSVCYNFYTTYTGQVEASTEADAYLQQRRRDCKMKFSLLI